MPTSMSATDDSSRHSSSSGLVRVQLNLQGVQCRDTQNRDAPAKEDATLPAKPKEQEQEHHEQHQHQAQGDAHPKEPAPSSLLFAATSKLLALPVEQLSKEAARAVKQQMEAAIAAGANPKARDPHGRSLLHMLLCHGLFQSTSSIIAMLIEQGADPLDCGQPQAQDSILHVLAHPDIGTKDALRQVHVLLNKLLCLRRLPHCSGTCVMASKLVTAMLEHPNAEGLPPLHHAIAQGNKRAMAAFIDLHLQLSVAPGVTTSKGDTPLHVAAALGKPRLLKVLLGLIEDASAGSTSHQGHQRTLLALSNGNARNHEGSTPLMVATAAKDVAAMELLLQRSNAGASVPGPQGTTALHIAVAARCLPAVRVLLQHHALASQADNQGTTPLLAAVRDCCPEILAELCRAASAALGLNAPSSSTGLTAMHEAAGMQGGHELIRIMAQAGGNVNAVSAQRCAQGPGLTPLHIACERNLQHNINALICYRADIHAEDAQGRSPATMGTGALVKSSWEQQNGSHNRQQAGLSLPAAHLATAVPGAVSALQKVGGAAVYKPAAPAAAKHGLLRFLRIGSSTNG